MPKYHIWTIGCQMNKAESERLGSHLEGIGHQAAANAEEADLIVLNSCVVRQSAENRVISKLKSLKALKEANAGLTIAVTGCMVNSEATHLKARFPHVDWFFEAGGQPPFLEAPDSEDILPRYPQPSTFVPIMQGCDNHCAYCIVPHRRGRERSRPAAEIIDETRELVRRGVKEVTLLGQNVDSYGHNLPEKPDLADLLGELNAIDGLARIRFLTNHPKDMSPRLIETVARLDKVCEQICLPVQSGDDAILRLMNRGYDAEHYRRLVADIRDQIPHLGLSTDVIVGFPSESEQQFQRTARLLSELRFDTVHVAAYSPRPGTPAAKTFADDIPPAEKKERRQYIERLQGEIAGEINSALTGKTVEVLAEKREKGKWQGRTRTGKLVYIHSDNDCRGQLVMTKIEKTSPWWLQGGVESTTTHLE